MRLLLFLAFSFALPSLVAAQEPAKEKKRGFVGVQIRFDDKAREVLISAVFFDAPAHKAGLQNGDVLLEINGTRPADLQDAVRRIQALKPGQKARFLIRRGEATRVVQVTVGEAPAA